MGLFRWSRKELTDNAVKLADKIEDCNCKIAILEKRLNIMQCEKHVWEADDKGFVGFNWMTGDGFIDVICKKCGEVEQMTEEELIAHKLDQALDEVERLGGEVDRGEG